MKVSPYIMRDCIKKSKIKNKDEGIARKYTKLKTQDEGIARTQCSKLHKMKLILEKKNDLQSPKVLPRNFEQKKCPTHLFTWKRKVGQRFKDHN